MIKITDRETGKELTLEECAREHGLGTLMLSLYVEMFPNGELIAEFTTELYNVPFNSQRFKLEITNDV